ncbi:MAG: saccharopine dehydrogenase NADP-binding domain-containing protein [Acidobacteriia bacterium]|nr:saccharopine dehydrogenase NADP-binding domain-containing protein [Terriglobia bacterium]
MKDTDDNSTKSSGQLGDESARAPALAEPLLVYGSYGQTGRLVAKCAIARGHEVLLSGAGRDRLDRQAAEIGARSTVAKLDDAFGLRQLVRNAGCVIHAAGPFIDTFRPMLEACIAENVPYVDLNGEWEVFRAIEELMGRRQPDIPVVSGVGFGVAAGESVALYAVGKLLTTERIWLGLAPDLGQRSRGALRSLLQTVSRGGMAVHNGRHITERVGRRSFRATLARRRRTFVSMPLGELWAVHRSTGVANIIGGVAVPAAERILLRSGLLGWLGRSPTMREWFVKRLAQDPGPGTPAFESAVWARAEDREGGVSDAILTMGEGYLWSAEAAVRAAERIIIHRRPGLWTPGQYFGKEFAASVSGTQLLQHTGS